VKHRLGRGALMRADAGAERLRDGAGEEAVRPRELCVEVVLEPRRGCRLLARGTVAVVTGRVHAVGPSTRLALIQAVTITPTVALLEGADDFAVCEGQLGVTLQGVWSQGGADLAEGGQDRSLPRRACLGSAMLGIARGRVKPVCAAALGALLWRVNTGRTAVSSVRICIVARRASRSISVVQRTASGCALLHYRNSLP
jgi:hypothetical protein